MNYQKVTPDGRLAHIIEDIWIHEDLSLAGRASDRPTRVLPTAAPELVFHYRDPYLLLNGKDKLLLPRISVAGQQTHPNDFMATGQTGLIVVRLRPWSLPSFFDFSTAEFTNVITDLKSITQTTAVIELEERLQEVVDMAERVNLVQEFLIRWLAERHQDHLVREIAMRLNSETNAPLRKVAADFHLSERQFERRFKRAIGLTPKKFALILRVQKSLGYIRLGKSGAEAALLAGYYDQAHFVKDFTQFTGHTPAKFITLEETRLATYFNSPGEQSLFYNTVYV